MAALTAEFLILELAEVDHREQFKYIGRSQLPKFKNMSIIDTVRKGSYYSCPKFQFWSTLLNCVQSIATGSISADSLDTEFLITTPDAHSLLPLSINSEMVNDVMTICGYAFEEMTEPFLVNHNIDVIEWIKNNVFYEALNNASKSFMDFAKREFTKGGGSFFQIIAKEHKAQFSVDMGAACSGTFDPMVFLEHLADEWASFWCNSESSSQDLAVLFKQLRETAKLNNEPWEFSAELLDESLEGYKKDTLGADFWNRKELSILPRVAKVPLSESVQYSHNHFVIPYQNLLNLNALLGKGEGLEQYQRLPCFIE